MTRKTWPPLDLKHFYSPDATVPQLFVEAAVSFPEKIALRGEEGDVTYSTLLNYAKTFASTLRKLGVARGSLVGLAASRSQSTVGAILGILLADAAYVPLDGEGSPAHLLRQQILDSNISLILLDQPRSGRANCCASEAWGDRATHQIPLIQSHTPSSVAISENVCIPEDPAYIMFTSGSTGKPKGVIVPHRAIARLVSAQRYLNFSPNETFLLHSPLGFDASTLELWGSLLHGGCLCVALPQVLGVNDYQEIIEKNEVTTLWMTAAMFHLVADYAPETFQSLRQLIVGGDVISPQQVRKVQRTNPNLDIVNGYGPTENCTFTACYRIPKNFDANVGLPIGRPIENSTIYVLDEQQRPVTDGEAGELVTGGPGVALGYVNRAPETAERFLPDPFSNDPEAHMYRTGDRVRRDPSGALHFLGRFDNEVKIGGRRIDLTALEGLASAFPGVRTCAAFAVSSSSGQKELALVVEMSSARAESEREVRQYFAARLPASLLPTHLHIVERLPVNQNGKLDRAGIRQRLEKSLHSLPSGGSPHEHEKALDSMLRMWRELLGKPTIGPDDNFFDAGGNSLMLIRLHALLNKQHEAKLSVVDLFQATTPRKLAQLLEERASSTSSSLAAVG